MTDIDARWPGTTLDPLMELRVLGATLPGVAYEERTLPFAYADVWSFIADLETSVPSFDPLVTSLRIMERSADGEQLRVRAWPSPFPFRVRLTDGLCVMHSPVFMVAMAAEPLGPTTTRFGHLEGLPSTGSPRRQALLRPLVRALRGIHRRSVHRDLAGIERCLDQRQGQD